LRRELAEMLVRGEIKDPRLEPCAAISITAVDVSPDLSNARVFVDVYSDELDLERVLHALHGAAGAIRRMLGNKVHLKRLPELRFEHDVSVGRGARVAEILGEIAHSEGAASSEASSEAETDAAQARPEADQGAHEREVDSGAEVD
jgi:ribosome-binding factor A